MQILAVNLPECLTPGEVLESYENDPLRIAELYFSKNDHKTAGYWTAIAFERTLDAKCPAHIGFSAANQTWQLRAKVEWLCSQGGFKSEYRLLNRLRELRNKAIHPNNSFSPRDARAFIDDMRKLVAIC